MRHGVGVVGEQVQAAAYCWEGGGWGGGGAGGGGGVGPVVEHGEGHTCYGVVTVVTVVL